MKLLGMLLVVAGMGVACGQLPSQESGVKADGNDSVELIEEVGVSIPA